MSADASTGRLPATRVAAVAAQRVAADRLLALLGALNLVGYPLVSTLPIALGVPSRPISVAFRAVVLLISVMVLGRWVRGRTRLASPLAFWLTVALWAIIVLRIGWDALVRPLPLALPWDEYLIFLTAVSAVPALALLQVPSAATLRLALGLTEGIGALAILGVGALGAQVLSDATSIARLATETLNPISMGELGLTVLIVSAYRILTDRPRRFWRTAARLLLCMLALLLMVASASKSPIIAAVMLALAAVGAQVLRQPSGPRIAASLLGVVVVVAVLGATAYAVEEFTGLKTVSRFTEFSTDESTLERSRLLKGTLDQVAGSPVVGSDVVELTMRAYPHNVFLESLMVSGVVGFAPFLLLNLLGFVAGLRLVVLGGPGAWVGYVYFQYLAAAMLSGSLIYGSHFWVTTSMAIAAALPLAARRPPATRPPATRPPATRPPDTRPALGL